ncbi:lipoprotein [Williamsoniiplasma lucivorax]|uniref:Lipoprotein n=1 Tax=Williamsoniiplasma lucivorax TaxID=209274 RepID=A0A2S5RG50_9MOLU|nr:lipoprotein [Williamsoniiplasma lucivorax]PPE06105.1 hypothetical protein ELUCI_v1c03960 [Williamsoniiplasma lucivorax]
MKKLLSLLSIFSLTAISGLTVIACNKNTNQEPGPGKPIITDEQINEYKTELDKVLINTFLDPVTQGKATHIIKPGIPEIPGTTIFNFEALQKQFPIDNNNDNKVQTLWKAGEASNPAVESMKKDLQQILHEDRFKDHYHQQTQTGDNFDKYKDMVINSWQDTFNGFVIQDNLTLKGQQFLSKPETKDVKREVMYTFNFNLAIDVNYFNADKIKTPYTTNPIPVTLTIGEEGAVIQIIQDLAISLPSELLVNREQTAQFKFEKLKTTEDHFKNYGDLQKPIANYINEDDGVFEKNLKNSIERITKGKVPAAKVKFGSEITTEKDVKVSDILFGTGNDYRQVKLLNDFANNGLANSLLLKPKEQAAMDKRQAMDLINKNVFKSVINPKSYDEKLSKFLTTYIKDEASLKKVVDEVYTYGTFSLKNITIQIPEQDSPVPIEVELPTLLIPWTYANDDTSGGNTYTSKIDAFLSSLYDSIKFVNQHLWSVNTGEKVKETLFAMGPEATQDYKDYYHKVTKKPWEQVKKELADGKEIQLSDKGSFGTPESGSLAGSLKKAPEMKFEGFKSWINTNYGNNLVIKKTSDGRIGLGFKKGLSGTDYKKVLLDYKIDFGKTRIQARMPWRGDSGGATGDLTGNLPGSLNNDFYGKDSDGNKIDETKYFKQAIANPDWLLFELDQIK